MRFSAFLLVSLAISAVCVSAAVDGSGSSQTAVGGEVYNGATSPSRTGTDPMCQLTSLSFTNGITLTTTFEKTVHTYWGTRASWTDFTSTQAVFVSDDIGASVFVSLNDVWIHSRAQNNYLGHINTPSKPLVLQVGLNKIVIQVSCNGMADPPCLYDYTVYIEVPPPSGGSVIGDPQFVGLLGQQYQVHGVAGEVYNIVSDADFAFNSKFVFLSEGQCPTINGRRAKNCWSHPGSYLGEIGLMTKEGDRIALVSGAAATGFASISFNGRSLAVGEEVTLRSGGLLAVVNTHQVVFRSGRYEITLENSDFFVNQNFKVKSFNGMDAHGLLGQTHKAKSYSGKIKQIQGEVDDYVIVEKTLFGTTFAYNKFKPQQ